MTRLATKSGPSLPSGQGGAESGGSTGTETLEERAKRVAKNLREKGKPRPPPHPPPASVMAAAKAAASASAAKAAASSSVGGPASTLPMDKGSPEHPEEDGPPPLPKELRMFVPTRERVWIISEDAPSRTASVDAHKGKLRRVPLALLENDNKAVPDQCGLIVFARIAGSAASTGTYHHDVAQGATNLTMKLEAPLALDPVHVMHTAVLVVKGSGDRWSVPELPVPKWGKPLRSVFDAFLDDADLRPEDVETKTMRLDGDVEWEVAVPGPQDNSMSYHAHLHRGTDPVAGSPLGSGTPGDPVGAVLWEPAQLNREVLYQWTTPLGKEVGWARMGAFGWGTNVSRTDIHTFYGKPLVTALAHVAAAGGAFDYQLCDPEARPEVQCLSCSVTYYGRLEICPKCQAPKSGPAPAPSLVSPTMPPPGEPGEGFDPANEISHSVGVQKDLGLPPATFFFSDPPANDATGRVMRELYRQCRRLRIRPPNTVQDRKWCEWESTVYYTEAEYRRLGGKVVLVYSLTDVQREWYDRSVHGTPARGGLTTREEKISVQRYSSDVWCASREVHLEPSFQIVLRPGGHGHLWLPLLDPPHIWNSWVTVSDPEVAPYYLERVVSDNRKYEVTGRGRDYVPAYATGQQHNRNYDAPNRFWDGQGAQGLGGRATVRLWKPSYHVPESVPRTVKAAMDEFENEFGRRFAATLVGFQKRMAWWPQSVARALARSPLLRPSESPISYYSLETLPIVQRVYGDRLVALKPGATYVPGPTRPSLEGTQEDSWRVDGMPLSPPCALPQRPEDLKAWARTHSIGKLNGCVDWLIRIADGPVTVYGADTVGSTAYNVLPARLAFSCCVPIWDIVRYIECDTVDSRGNQHGVSPFPPGVQGYARKRAWILNVLSHLSTYYPRALFGDQRTYGVSQGPSTDETTYYLVDDFGRECLVKQNKGQLEMQGRLNHSVNRVARRDYLGDDRQPSGKGQSWQQGGKGQGQQDRGQWQSSGGGGYRGQQQSGQRGSWSQGGGSSSSWQPPRSGNQSQRW